MTAALLSRARSPTAGLRQVDPRRDMAAVADLVQVAFAGQLDQTGERMVRDMRAFGRAGWIGWLLGRLILPPAAYPEGFVWEEGGRLVGNASLLPVDGYPHRWVMANVAVHPDYRRRGIAKAMVMAGLELACERRGEVVLLQVNSANREAQILYAGLGFHPLCTRTTWTRRAPPTAQPPGSTGLVRRRQGKDWEDQLALARRLHPEGLVWPFPLEESFFRPGAIALDGGRHWVWVEGGRVQASLSAQPVSARLSWRLVLIVEPEARGKAEGLMLAHALRELPWGGPATLDYPAGVAEQALWGLGFRPDHTLTWMAFDLTKDRESRSFVGSS